MCLVTSMYLIIPTLKYRKWMTCNTHVYFNFIKYILCNILLHHAQKRFTMYLCLLLLFKYPCNLY